jgi:Ankyrin repeats (3 copies)
MPSSHVPLQNHKAAEQNDPLNEPGILLQILDYVGLGSWLFTALVNSEWKQLYERVVSHEAEGVNEDGTLKKVKCNLKTTLASAAFFSTARARFAHEYGLNLAGGKHALQCIAGRSGSTNVLTLLRELGLPFTASVACGAADARSMSKLIWLQFVQNCPLTTDVADYASTRGDIAMLQYLKHHGVHFSVDTSYNAAASADIETLQYLLSEDCPWDEEVTAAAASQGHLTALQWLIEHGCPCDKDAIVAYAAMSGSYEVVQYLRSIGAAFTSDALRGAAWKGHLELCKQLYAEQCPLAAAACSAAAEQGHLHVLQWLLDNDCPVNSYDISVNAAYGGSISSVNYLVEQGVVELSARWLTDMLNAAGAQEHLAAAQWCRQKGAVWPTVLMYDKVSWTAATLAWARAEGCTARTTEYETE